MALVVFDELKLIRPVFADVDDGGGAVGGEHHDPAGEAGLFERLEGALAGIGVVLVMPAGLVDGIEAEDDVRLEGLHVLCEASDGLRADAEAAVGKAVELDPLDAIELGGGDGFGLANMGQPVWAGEWVVALVSVRHDDLMNDGAGIAEIEEDAAEVIGVVIGVGGNAEDALAGAEEADLLRRDGRKWVRGLVFDEIEALGLPEVEDEKGEEYAKERKEDSLDRAQELALHGVKRMVLGKR